MGVDVPGLQFESATVVHNDIGKLPKLREGQTQMVMRFRVAFMPRQRTPDQVGRRLGAAELEQENAEIVQGSGMLRIGRQQIAVGGFGLG